MEPKSAADSVKKLESMSDEQRAKAAVEIASAPDAAEHIDEFMALIFGRGPQIGPPGGKTASGDDASMGNDGTVPGRCTVVPTASSALASGRVTRRES